MEASKPSLVFLCQRIPYPPIKGERITSFNLLRHLVRDYRVSLGTFIDDASDVTGIPTLRSMVADLYVGTIRKPWAYARAFPRWLNGDPLSFALFRSRGLERWLDRVEADHPPVAVVTHSSNISAYAVDKFRRPSGTEPRRVLHFADVDSEKFVAYADLASGPKKWLFATEARRVRREERRLAAGADVVALVTDEEANLFRSVLVANREHVVTLPNGVDTETFSPDRYPETLIDGAQPSIVFTGAMDYPPNVQAVTWFAREVFPRVRASLPGVRFVIVGSRPTADVRKLASEGAIIVTGRVDSVAPYLAAARLVVAPLLIARGIQNKVLEAMAMAKAVVVSPGALAGITARPGEHLICADAASQWVETCVDLLADPEKARRLGRNARQLILEQYTWDAQFARLDRLLRPGDPPGMGKQTM
jgi:sugar transferase (PEP-CTERM/EpsH1 system associated)